MSLRKFGPTDVLLNTMKAHPECEFVIFNGNIYFNSVPEHSGAFADNILNVSSGHVSLYEINVDRGGFGSEMGIPGSVGNKFITPFITKNGSRMSFKTVSASAFDNYWDFGDIMSGSYPMSASIVREYMDPTNLVVDGTASFPPSASGWPTINYNKHFYALKNRLDWYGYKSEHYKVSSSHGNKNHQILNLISIPSIIYGSQIKPGTVSLKMYYTGTLCGEIQDTKRNGELRQVSGAYSTSETNIGKVAGVVLYDEGFILLTGSWRLNGEQIVQEITRGSSLGLPIMQDFPKWIHWGVGANDSFGPRSPAKIPQGHAPSTGVMTSASFSLSFKGTTEIQTTTMFAHAPRGKVNYSNNPTFLKYRSNVIPAFTSSNVYEEDPQRLIKNTVSSSNTRHSASFMRQVYISKVAVYDQNQQMIGIATLSNPILKEEGEDMAFKIKVDI